MKNLSGFTFFIREWVLRLHVSFTMSTVARQARTAAGFCVASQTGNVGQVQVPQGWCEYLQGTGQWRVKCCENTPWSNMPDCTIEVFEHWCDFGGQVVFMLLQRTYRVSIIQAVIRGLVVTLTRVDNSCFWFWWQHTYSLVCCISFIVFSDSDSLMSFIVGVLMQRGDNEWLR